MKPLKWGDSSKKDFDRFHENVKDSIGFALYQAQKGEKHVHAQYLKNIKAVEVVETDHMVVKPTMVAHGR